MSDSRVCVSVKELNHYVNRILQKNGMTEEDAKITADVLLCGDRRGIQSHGVARLKRYVDGIKTGIINLDANIKTVNETPVSLVIDGDGGMGQVVTYHAMKRCIEKAKENFMCFAAIRNSNHYGIAGYYSKMALQEKMIGFSFTNSAPLVVPTFGKNAVLGTNPISVGVPAGEEDPYLLDMATSTVPRGKLEVYAREEREIPETWATDDHGLPTTDPQQVLHNLLARNGGGLLPIGGSGMTNAGHKGYGLAVLVDILCGVFSGGAVGTDVYGKKGAPAEVAHFVGVINPDAFIGLDALQERMDYFIRMLKHSELAKDQVRIYVAGEMEFETARKTKETLTLQEKVFETLNELGKEFEIELKDVKCKQ